MMRIGWLLLMALLVMSPSTGRAQSADEALAALSSPSFETIRQGVSMLAVSAGRRHSHGVAGEPAVCARQRQGTVHQDRWRFVHRCDNRQAGTRYRAQWPEAGAPEPRSGRQTRRGPWQPAAAVSGRDAGAPFRRGTRP